MMKDCDGSEILLEAHSLVTGERQKQYAHPLEDYTQAKDIFQGMTGIALTVQQAILFMVAVKLSRLRTALSNDGWHHDTVVDAAGYLACLAMVEHKMEQQ